MQLSEKEKKQIVKKYKSGTKVKVLSSTYKVSESYIYKILRINGVKTDVFRNSKKIPKDTVKQILKDYKNPKLNTNDIAKKYNMSVGKLYLLLEQNNVKKRGQGNVVKTKYTKTIIQNIIKDYKNEVLINDIASKYKISKFSIYKILSENNVPKRGRGANFKKINQKRRQASKAFSKNSSKKIQQRAIIKDGKVKKVASIKKKVVKKDPAIELMEDVISKSNQEEFMSINDGIKIVIWIILILSAIGVLGFVIYWQYASIMGLY